MVRVLSRRGFLSAIGALPLFAGDSWQDKKYTEWDDKQVQKMLNDSPWAKKAASGGGAMVAGGSAEEGLGGGRGGRGGGGGGMGGGSGAMGGAGGGESGGMESAGGGRGGRGGGGGGGMSGGAGMPPMSLTVRWLSSMAIQHAFARQYNREVATAAPDVYVIGAFGLPRNLMRGDAGRVEQMKKMLGENTHLVAKGRDPFPMMRLDVANTGEVAALLFQFSGKDHPISLDDKEVEFEMKFGRLDFKCKFKPKDMLYEGKLSV